MTKKLFLILFLTILSYAYSYGQKQFVGIERGAMLGTSFYGGDLNPEMKLNRPKISLGLLAKYNFSNYISLVSQLDYSRIGYADSLNTTPFEKTRNLNFENNTLDFRVSAEFNFFRFRTGDFDHRWTPYLGSGMGVLYYNPYTYYEGNRYFLRDLGTEGQFTSQYADRKYGKFAFYIPVTFGIKYWMRPGLNLAFEFVQKFTFTDYLDDVSTTYVGGDKFIFNGRPDKSYFMQDRSGELDINPIGIEGRQRGTSTNNDFIIGFQIKLTYMPQKYLCIQ